MSETTNIEGNVSENVCSVCGDVLCTIHTSVELIGTVTKFKVGDWAIAGFQTKPFKYDPMYCGYQERDLRHWRPEIGEWCWFKKEFVKVNRIEETGYVYFDTPLGCTKWCEEADLLFLCEPFIGELPSFAKDEQ
jgi:hypothetical protein